MIEIRTLPRVKVFPPNVVAASSCLPSRGLSVSTRVQFWIAFVRCTPTVLRECPNPIFVSHFIFHFTEMIFTGSTNTVNRELCSVFGLNRWTAIFSSKTERHRGKVSLRGVPKFDQPGYRTIHYSVDKHFSCIFKRTEFRPADSNSPPGYRFITAIKNTPEIVFSILVVPNSAARRYSISQFFFWMSNK